jgi:Stress responsive A/B Barrel Domain
MNLKRSYLILAVLFCTSCQSMNLGHSPPRIYHIIICWLKEPGNDQDRNRLIEASKSLEKIPGVLDVRVGRVLPDTRTTTDSTFDVALVMTFQDEQSLRAYPKSPVHTKMLNEVIQPVVQRYVAYDFVESP